MPLYRIFTNDRGMKRGIPMYSALMPVQAANAEAAIAQVSPSFGPPVYASIVAIEWPAKTQASKDWLASHT
jgi:hypothetical protein